MEVLLLIAFVAVVSFAACQFSMLSFSGGIAAFICGLAIAMGAGWKGLVLLGIFFGSSSLLSKLKRDEKKKFESRHEKGSQRDWVQVFANGGIPAVLAILLIFMNENWLVIGFSIAFASANADTWASELGVLSKGKPISIKSFRRVEPGTSGAVSFKGTLAAAAGSLVVSLSAAALFSFHWADFFVVFIFGFFGMLIDTLLGAFFQAVYRCKVCGAEVECRRHCNSETTLVKGKDPIRNDAVNLISCLGASLLGICFYMLT